ncbi:AtpA1 [Desulforapulum autotrophicum HRM2]|uniref:ATP synthase subunit alpha n=1 Tax=Desulforapulum autotrophicum (strain ATCC 43914 / DSM 3382 / VKM B-1955 / HRM2) TaxID=177437 RepID=C0Q8V3_DESAH|nr:F0F1 ATP synthase subunit alpha [Desulforapulum autotrophicum]ACN14443.1 AtpA1 [Desulforapulum autotrophicum HRM2]
MLKQIVKQNENAFDRALEAYHPELRAEDVGRVIEINGPIIQATGLANAFFEELVECRDGTLGIVASLMPRTTGIILLGKGHTLGAGMEIRRLERPVDVPVGQSLLGRVIDPTGKPMDNKGPMNHLARWPVERPAPEIMERAPVSAPLETGIKVIDTLIPIGKGQRQLILGDRQTGKTAIAVDTIINQRGKNVVCVYAAIGQRESAVAKVLQTLEAHDALSHTILVAAGCQDPPGLQYIAPYAACTIGEYFMNQGRDVLIVYDDLTRHARAYRELSLLLERPPGREAFPGDIFYVHSRLLERSTHLRAEKGNGSLTALPVIETEAQNLSAYIPTNLISITDGQIYLSPDFFAKGVLPAVDVGKSVSRVGGKAQPSAFHAITGSLRLSYSQFEELESFARFASRLDNTTKSALERGKRVRKLLEQPRFSPFSDFQQVTVMLALTQGFFDFIAMDKIEEAEALLALQVNNRLPEICRNIAKGACLTQEETDELLGFCRETLDPLTKGQPDGNPADPDPTD